MADSALPQLIHPIIQQSHHPRLHRVSPNRKLRNCAGTSRRKLRLATGATGETVGRRVSRWWHRGFRKSSFSAIYGLFLIAPAWWLTRTFFAAFSQAGQQAFWASEECWFFGLGAVVWTLAFFGGVWAKGEPWPLHVYVFGHELTHAIWIWLWRGKVIDKKMWASDGGYIVTDTHNFWIALAPYFYPLYSLVVIVAYGVASVFYDVAHTTGTFIFMTPLQWLFFLLGGTWAFHLTFTVWMIPKGQSDLTTHGTFFSLVVIYVMNLLVLSVFLIVAAPEITFGSFGSDLLGRAEDFSEMAWRAFRAAWMKLAT
jgi:hypothetical protein